MDDARVSRVPAEEVLAAEAYMLFYRAVEHPTIVNLREQHKAWIKEQATTTVAVAEQPPVSTATTTNAVEKSPEKKRKRETPDFISGEEWALEMLRMPPAVVRSLMRRAEEVIADRTDLTPEYFARIEEAARKERGAPGSLGGTFVNTIADLLLPGGLLIMSCLASFLRG
jgi:hypothetical protein